MAPTLTFYEHIAELRKRLLWVAVAVFVSAALGYNFRKPITALLQHPLGSPLFYSSPAGSFNFVIQVSMIVGIFVALPIMVYQLLRFIEPALPKRIRRWSMLSIIGTSLLLAVIGATFAFYYVVPTSLKFFAGYDSAQIQPLISANEYLSFVINSIVTFAIIFQIPLIFFFIDRIKPIKPGRLLKYQRHVIVAAFLIAVLLPFTYDPITQFIIATPIIFLYYLSLLVLVVTNRQRAGRRRRTVTMPTYGPKTTTKHNAPTQPQKSFLPRPTLSVDGLIVHRQTQNLVSQPASAVHITLQAKQPLALSTTSRPQKQRLSIDGFIQPRLV